jgi:hypothetical protein
VSEETKVLSDWEKQQSKNARHRALILQILNRHPEGLTTQQVIEKELETYGYSFLTDNRLRELRSKGFVENADQLGKPQLWKVRQE